MEINMVGINYVLGTLFYITGAIIGLSLEGILALPYDNFGG